MLSGEILCADRYDGPAKFTCLPSLRELGLALDFLDRAQEERLVDPALKDRHTELHALRDDFAPVHPRLAAELGGRQVDRHWSSPPRVVSLPNVVMPHGGQGPERACR